MKNYLIETDSITEITADNGVEIDGLIIKDEGFALGSDADGDVYVRSGGKLARIAKGSANQVFKMNSLGTIPEFGNADAFPSGTKILFYQNAAPTGWTIDTSLNDKLVYITRGSGAGGQTGGQIHTTGSWTITGFSGYSDYYTLTTNDIPSHAHTFPFYGSWNAGFGGQISQIAPVGGAHIFTTSYSGGGAGHRHAISSLTHDGAWRPAAYNCIICTKD
jgi:hypothetical protein